MIVIIILVIVAAIVVAGIMKAQRRMAYADGLRAAQTARNSGKPSWTGHSAKTDMFRSFVRAKARSQDVSEKFISLTFEDDELLADMLSYAAEVERRGGDFTAQINECSKLLVVSWEKIPLVDRTRLN